MLTSTDLIARLGYGSPQILIRWQRLGLIPRPTVSKHPRGRGKIGYWPEWVFDRCQQIRRLQQDGLPLQEIAGRLGSDWAAEERAWEERQKAQVVAESARPSEPQIHRLADEVQFRLFELATWRLGQQVFRSVEQRESRTFAAQAIDLAFRGFRPVLVLLESGCFVVADFAAGIVATCPDPHGDDEPRLIVPLYPIIQRHLGEAFPALRNVPRWNLERDCRITTTEGRSRRIRILKNGQFEELADDDSPGPDGQAKEPKTAPPEN